MTKRFLVTGLITTVINLLLFTAGYVFFLKDFFQSHPAGSEEFMNQLERPPDQLIIWAMVVTSLAMACAAWMLGRGKTNTHENTI